MAPRAVPPWPHGDGEMARRLRAFDWSKTPLGPIEDWPEDLRASVALIASAALDASGTGEEQRPAQSQRRQSFLLGLSDRLRAEPDADAIAKRTIEMLSGALGLDRCYVASFRLRDGWADVTHQVRRAGLFPLPDMLRLAGDAATLRGTFDRTAVIDNAVSASGSSLFDRQDVDAIGLGAYVAAAVRQGDNRPIWSIVAASSTPRHWTRSEVALVEEVAERSWAAIERARAENELRESEERLRMALEAGRMGSWSYDLATGEQQWSEQQFRLFGLEPGQQPPTRETFLSLVHPDDLPLIEFTDADLAPGRGLLDAEFRIVRPDGEVRWLVAHTVVRRDATGSPIEMIGLNWDITQSKHAELALSESEERFRQFAQASSGALWIREATSLAMEYVSPAIRSIYGIEPDRLIGGIERWAALIVPDDRQSALQHIERARRGESAIHEFRIRRQSDGVFRWIRNTDFPLRDEHGRIQRIGGIAEDITEAKLAIEHQAVLLAELQHRVRNTMAMIRSMATRTAETAASVRDYAELIAGRLTTLARTQTLLTRAANVGVDITTLVRHELDAQANQAGQFSISGPDVVIPPKSAEILSLAIHELATNALKYGALSVPEGTVSVTWRVVLDADGPQLSLSWSERRSPAADWTAPVRRGFGTELIERRVPYELGGRGNIEITAEGARALVEFPLQPGASMLETDAPLRRSVFGGSVDMSGETSLAGQRVLVVEDDYYLASDTANVLRSAGAEVVGPFPRETQAVDALSRESVSSAVIDINFGNGPSFETATALRQANLPFAFLTGYDGGTIPQEFADVPRLEKPVELRQIVRTLARMIRERGPAA